MKVIGLLLHLRTLILGKAGHHVVRSLKQSHGVKISTLVCFWCCIIGGNLGVNF